MTSRAVEIRDALLLADRLDSEWQHRVPDDDRRYAGWMPFNSDNFLTLALAAMRAAPGDPPYFLEIGAGIGTKMMLARVILGLHTCGIERDAVMAIQAAKLGGDVEVGDAIGYGGYGKADLIWFNRACRDPVLQAQLETQVWEDMRPGAVVMCANLEAPPPASWIIVDQDVDHAVRGSWLKPSLA